MKYTVVIEEGPSSYGAYVPDLPIYVAIAETLEEKGEPVPEPRSHAEMVEVS